MLNAPFWTEPIIRELETAWFRERPISVGVAKSMESRYKAAAGRLDALSCCLPLHSATKREPQRRRDTCSDAGILAAVSSGEEDTELRVFLRFSCGESLGIKVTPGGGEFLPCKCFCVYTGETERRYLLMFTFLWNTRLVSGSQRCWYWNLELLNLRCETLFYVFLL